MNLPQKPGFYLWYIIDQNYLDVGIAQVFEDKKDVLAHIQSRPKKGEFHIYKNNEGKNLVLYHSAYDHLPPVDESNMPIVDGWKEFDITQIESNKIYGEKHE